MSRFQAILALIPGIVQMVQLVENQGMPPKSGPTKLDMVTNTISVAAQAEPGIASALSAGDIQSATQNIASGVVAGMNAAGVFKTTPASN